MRDWFEDVRAAVAYGWSVYRFLREKRGLPPMGPGASEVPA